MSRLFYLVILGEMDDPPLIINVRNTLNDYIFRPITTLKLTLNINVDKLPIFTCVIPVSGIYAHAKQG